VGLSRDKLPRVWDVLKERGLLIFPLFIIIYLLVSGRSPFMAAFWGIIYATATGQIHQRTKPFLMPLLLSVLPCLFGINPFESTAVLVGWAGFAAIAFFYFWRTSELLPTGIALGITALLTGLLFFGVETSLAAFWSSMLIVLVGICYKESKMSFRAILSSLEDGTKNAIAIGAACACVGFIVGATTLTGIGLKFATAVIAVAHQIAVVLHPLLMGLSTVNDITLFFTLINTALACFVLGMGIPTTAQYIIAAMIAAPALMEWGIHPLVSHMFVFYYAILADVTPPVALAAYAASGISGADPFKTGLRAFTLASGGFIIPLVFVSSPIVLWMPSILDGTIPFDYVWFGQVLLTMFLGVIALGATIIGYLKDHSTNPERIATGIAAITLIFPGTITDILGMGLLAGVFTVQLLRKRKKLRTATPETGPEA
jgi:TRAP transporter 4TM/12TM fusion protein